MGAYFKGLRRFTVSTSRTASTVGFIHGLVSDSSKAVQATKRRKGGLRMFTVRASRTAPTVGCIHVLVSDSSKAVRATKRHKGVCATWRMPPLGSACGSPFARLADRLSLGLRTALR